MVPKKGPQLQKAIKTHIISLWHLSFPLWEAPPFPAEPYRFITLGQASGRAINSETIIHLYGCILYKQCFFGKLQQKSAIVLLSFAGIFRQESGKVLIYSNKELKGYGVC